MKTIIIAYCDESIKNMLVKCLSLAKGYSNIIECRSEIRLLKILDEADEPLVFLDKYFLGYVISYKLMRLRHSNNRTEFCFLEKGDCPRYFGLRLHKLNVNSFIANIEEKKHMSVELDKVLQGYRTYPREIVRSIESNDQLLDYKYTSDVTPCEMKVALYLGEGKSQKEISYLTGLSTSTVSTYVCRLNRKIGFKSALDYCILRKQAMYMGGESDS